jgi:hypothetical protein
LVLYQNEEVANTVLFILWKHKSLSIDK